jgi:hypothetical protein
LAVCTIVLSVSVQLFANINKTSNHLSS